MGHPVRAVPGVEMPTGSLGHGLALGCGFALAARYADRDRRSFVLLGDGELQEGSVWEAAIAAASLRLDRLIAVVDRNGLQLTGSTESIAPMEPLADRWRAFGWAVRDVDGHDPGAGWPSRRRAVGTGQAECADRPHGQGPRAPVPRRPQCQPLT